MPRRPAPTTSRRHRAALAALCVLAFVAASCSSTSEIGLRSSAPSPDAPLAPGDPSALSDDVIGEGPQSSDLPAKAGAPRQRSGKTTPETVTVDGKTLRVSQGLRDGKLDIGIPWFDAGAAGLAVQAITGYSDASIADSKAQAEAVVKHINATGGIAGLEINPVFYQLQVASSTTASGRARDAQAACTRWTQDTHVFAFLVIIGPDDNYLQCAQDTNTPILTSGFPEGVDAVQYAAMPNLIYAPASLVFDDREKMLVDQMARAGVLNEKTKVGLMIDGSVSMAVRSARNTLIPELKRRKIPIASEIVFPDCVESPWDTYALQMRQAGVTHVYFSGTYCGSVPLLLFGRSADSQRWEPHYVISSDQGPAGNGNRQISDKGPRLHGVGWLPGADDGSVVDTPSRATCSKIMEEAGQADSTTTDIFATGRSYCETLLFLQAALRGSTDLSPGGLGAGAARLADSWAPVVTRGADFRNNHHFAANTVQRFAFDDSCGCMKYVGAPTRFR